MKNGLEVTSQIVDIWENAELMTKKIQVAKTKVRNRIPTLVARISMSTRLFIQKFFFSQHGLIKDHMLINFLVKFQPT